MITVVIPTMLKCPLDVFEYTLNQLNLNNLVKEIIIIDNTETKNFDKVFMITSKMNIIKLEGNQGASYNVGMKICKTKYYLLLNDDVACRSSIIDNCFEIMEKENNVGLIQIETIVRQPLNIYINSDKKSKLEYIFPPNPKACMTGWFQFGRKEDWIEIPKELKYFYGDDLLLANMSHKKRNVARITSDHISHIESSTVSVVVLNAQEFLRNEEKIYHDIIKRMFNK